MQKLHLYKRLTHKYVDSCRDLDRHEYLGDVMLTPPRMTREPADFDDGGTYVRYATLPAGLDRKARKEFREVLAENLSKHGCAHEYDCCGCESRSARVYPTQNTRRVVIRVSVGYNY